MEVEIPEHLVLDYELAGIGSRALAALIDLGVILLLEFALLMVLVFVFGGLGRWAEIVLLWSYFGLLWGYFTFFEGLRAGQTPGKRRVGIRVVQDTGHPVTLADAAARNLLRVADFLPPPYLLGGIMVAVHPRAKRLGDLVAGTVVVRDHPAELTVEAPLPKAEAEEPPAVVGVPELADDEFRLLQEFEQRTAELPYEVRARVARTLVDRFTGRYPRTAASDGEFLARLYREEVARRRSAFGARTARPGSESAIGSGSAVAERLVARQRGRWEEFRGLAARAAREGLDSFRAEELPDFAARYREVVSDLARARVYGASPATIGFLERLVAAGHNTLYRAERRPWRSIGRFLGVECPAAIIEARWYVAVAFAAFAVPAAGGYFVLRERPALAEEVLPGTLLERAEAGRTAKRSGIGYFDAPPGSRPLVATSIITNNLTVAFNCFAGGIFFGVGSLFLLAYNGLSIGAASGHFANLGLFGYLWTFVIGHGVLELFAIWVSGAAGLMLGRALIAPGELSRRDALKLHGRVAIRMIGAVVLFLIVAGLIEGFVSAGRAPIPLRAGASVTSAVLLVWYLVRGWRAAEGRRDVPNVISFPLRPLRAGVPS